jgi:adenylate kinase family enzyme
MCVTRFGDQRFFLVTIYTAVIMNQPHVRILFILGRPNAGKTTQARMLAAGLDSSVLAISPGQWLRDLSAQQQQSDLGSFVFHNWSHDALTPLVTDFIDKTLNDVFNKPPPPPPQRAPLVVIDGYPRSVVEVGSIAALVRGHEFAIVELDSSEETLRSRGLTRQRATDDTSEAMDIRLDSYAANIVLVKEALHKLGVNLLRIASDATADEIHRMLVAVVTCTTSFRRLPIPSQPPRKLLARKLFMEADPIDSATIVQRCLRLAHSTRLRKTFFGTHPISLTRVDLPRIRRYPYMVSLKASGVRYLCLVACRRLWLVSRTLAIYQGPMLPELERFENTLLDGELIGEEDASYFIVFDCLASCGENCMRDNIIGRLRRSVELGRLLYNGPLMFRPQKYVDRGQMFELVASAKELPWEVDGVIFQPARLPYRLGIDYNMFKWKPLGENTCDFYYNAADSGLYCRVNPSEQNERMSEIAPIDLSQATRISRDGIEMVRFGRLLTVLRPTWLRDAMIIECSALMHDKAGLLAEAIEREQWGVNELVWVPQKHRGDKHYANIEWVSQSVIQSIIDDISQEELERECVSRNLTDQEMPTSTTKRVPHAGAKRAHY